MKTKRSWMWCLFLGAVAFSMLAGCVEEDHDHYRGGYEPGYGYGYGQHDWDHDHYHDWNYDHGDHEFHEGRP